MSDKTIFFSYSRDNSEFVLNLAKELREAGAKVWLDQLDISPGSRWDKSIESALEKSSTLLVVLSKSSVASHNVMDEVSYALEEGKTVVPILLEECDIPFRLRRLQFADFSTSHKTGISTLTKALNLGDDVASKLVTETDTPAKAAPVEKPVPVTQLESGDGNNSPSDAKSTSARATTPTKSSGSKKTLMYVVIAAVLVVAVWGIYSLSSGGHDDKMAMCKADWEEMEAALADEDPEMNEIAALRRHIELYAPCPHENEAMDRISFLKAMGSEADAVSDIDNEEPEDEPASSSASGAADNNNVETGSQQTNNTIIQPKEIVEEAAITGQNVSQVNYTGGYFKQKSPKIWVEQNENGERLFTVIKKDKDAVFLKDGDVKVTLDITNFAIYYSDPNTEPFLLYTISDYSN
jgi:hypothetical protein